MADHKNQALEVNFSEAKTYEDEVVVKKRLPQETSKKTKALKFLVSQTHYEH